MTGHSTSMRVLQLLRLPTFSYPPKRGRAAPYFLAHVCCGQTVAHLSYCRALESVIPCCSGCT